ncbi:3521_t:CDS:1, partial [Scutellospora calospora]
FDFETSNAKFDKDDLVKKVVKIIYNGDFKNENYAVGVELGPDDNVLILYPFFKSHYDKAKSTF